MKPRAVNCHWASFIHFYLDKTIFFCYNISLTIISLKSSLQRWLRNTKVATLEITFPSQSLYPIMNRSGYLLKCAGSQVTVAFGWMPTHQVRFGQTLWNTQKSLTSQTGVIYTVCDCQLYNHMAEQSANFTLLKKVFMYLLPVQRQWWRWTIDQERWVKYIYGLFQKITWASGLAIDWKRFADEQRLRIDGWQALCH